MSTNYPPATEARWSAAGRALAERSPSTLDAFVSLAELQRDVTSHRASAVTTRVTDVEKLLAYWDDAGRSLGTSSPSALAVVLSMAEGAIAEIGP